MSKKYKVCADFGIVGFNETFNHLYFAIKSAKVALKRGAKVTIATIQPTPTKQEEKE